MTVRMLVALTAATVAAMAAACSDAPTRPAPVAEKVAAAGDGGTPTHQAAPSILLRVPEDSPGPPFYAITGNGGFIPHDTQWGAIPFVRSLGCVPSGQNLMVPAIPAAFGCSLTVEGHEHWETGPGIDIAPRQTQFMGLGAVPIVFARWAELQPATAGGLTLAELRALPSALEGTADFYKETDILGISGPLGAGRGAYKISARGRLDDGRSFRLHVDEVLGELRVVEIEFR